MPNAEASHVSDASLVRSSPAVNRASPTGGLTVRSGLGVQDSGSEPSSPPRSLYRMEHRSTPSENPDAQIEIRADVASAAC
jgi:hypothetical protein